MVAMTIQNQACTRESIERKPWTSEAWNDVFVFLAQSFGVVCGAIFFYAVGPALGVTLIAVSLAVRSFLRSQTAEGEDKRHDDGGQAVSLNSPSHCADPVWLRSSGMSFRSTALPVVRQGA